VAAQHDGAGAAGVRGPGKVDSYDVDGSHRPFLRSLTSGISGERSEATSCTSSG
jgi:hypothetical protein